MMLIGTLWFLISFLAFAVDYSLRIAYFTFAHTQIMIAISVLSLFVGIACYALGIRDYLKNEKKY